MPELAASRRMRAAAARSSPSPAGTPTASQSASRAAAAPRAPPACGNCGKTAPVAIRGRDGKPDICVNCYRLPARPAAYAGGYGPAHFAGTSQPVCKQCAPRATAACARCGQDRPPHARWPEGPVCDTCYTAALRRRIPCASCGQVRRPVSPPGADADTCASCAGLPVTSACADCGTEDKMFEKHRCARCSLRRRAAMLLSAGTGNVPAALAAVLEAISAARTPESALNWLRTSAGAAILADLAAGRLAVTHEALDQHPRPRAASHLRHMLIAGGVLPPRDEELARTEQWLAALLASIDVPGHRRLVHAFATWHVMRRLRRAAGARPPALDLYRSRADHDQGSGRVPRLARRARHHLAWLPPGRRR